MPDGGGDVWLLAGLSLLHCGSGGGSEAAGSAATVGALLGLVCVADRHLTGAALGATVNVRTVMPRLARGIVATTCVVQVKPEVVGVLKQRKGCEKSGGVALLLNGKVTKLM